MAAERVLVNFFYAQPVGHAIEALHYCLGHHAADPEREIAVALNAATPVEIAGWCPFVSAAYAIDHPFLQQLAIVEACDVFVAPHTGFGMAALAVGTPWLAISGGRWFEYFFNRVPFRSILPDTGRYPAFSQFDELPVVDDGDDGPRTPSMSQARIREDLDAIAAAAVELVEGTVDYEEALADYFAALLHAHRGDATAIWSIDGVHAEYLARGDS